MPIISIWCFVYQTTHQKLASLLNQGSPAAPRRNGMHKVARESQLSDFATCDWKRAIFEHPRLRDLKACAYGVYYNSCLDAILEPSTLYSSDFTS